MKNELDINQKMIAVLKYMKKNNITVKDVIEKNCHRIVTEKQNSDKMGV